MNESSEYRVTSSEMVSLATGEYLRLFWWYVAIVPLFGLLCLLFGGGVLRPIGGFALLWPFSIPARAVISTTKARRLFRAGVRARIEEDGLYIVPSQMDVKGLRLRWGAVRDVRERGAWAIVRTRRFGFLPVPPEVGRGIAERMVGATKPS
ncbi:hypothetical protein BH11ARM2_BH11ARM2_39570 [soil metagenome]